MHLSQYVKFYTKLVLCKSFPQFLAETTKKQIHANSELKMWFLNETEHPIVPNRKLRPF